VRWAADAPLDALSDEATLADRMGRVGLCFEDRRSQHDASHNMYGDDVRYMLPRGPGGMWQTPLQLAKYVQLLSTCRVRTYLDIGTYTGWTVTVVAAVLARFGLDTVHTYDVNEFCGQEVQRLWADLGLPITYVLRDTSALLPAYDAVFIDGDHEQGVFEDFERYKHRARIIAFHDINDAYCPCVRQCWHSVRSRYAADATFDEFTEHPNGFSVMGIGVMRWAHAALYASPYASSH
jgi:hypothetical protein